MALVERLQRERGAVAQASTPGGSLLQQFRSGLRQKEQGCLPYTCCNELNEVQQHLVGPVKILEKNAQRLATRQCFEEAAHRHLQAPLVSQRCSLMAVYLQSAKPRQVIGNFSGIPCGL